MSRRLLLLCLFAIHVNGDCADRSASPREYMMNPVNQRLLELTSLSQDAYFADSTSRLFELQGELNEILASSSTPETELLWINGPRALDVGQRQDLPVLVLRYASGERNWKVSSALNQYLVVQNLDSGSVRLQLLTEQGEERAPRPRPSGSGQAPDSNTAMATGTALRRLFLRDLLKLPWQPARMAFTVVSYDAISNTVAVSLTQAAAAPPKAGLPTLRASEFVSCPPSTASARTDFTGLTWSLANTSSSSPIALGQFRAAAASVPLARSAPDGVLPDLVRVALLVVSLDKQPRLVDLAIPATFHGDSGSDQTVSANFCIDLNSVVGTQASNAIQQLYLISGLYSAGPVQVPAAR